MSFTAKIFASVFALLIITPNICAVVIPFEDWPFTNAPMFAHSIDESSPRYKFIFLGKFADGSTDPLGYYDVGASWSLMRFFFKYVYGSAEEHSVFNQYPADTPEKFIARLERFFGAFATEVVKRRPQSAPLVAIELSAARLSWEDNAAIETHTIGIFDVVKKNFKHSWHVSHDFQGAQ